MKRFLLILNLILGFGLVFSLNGSPTWAEDWCGLKMCCDANGGNCKAAEPGNDCNCAAGMVPKEGRVTSGAAIPNVNQIWATIPNLNGDIQIAYQPLGEDGHKICKYPKNVPAIISCYPKAKSGEKHQSEYRVWHDAHSLRIQPVDGDCSFSVERLDKFGGSTEHVQDVERCNQDGLVLDECNWTKAKYPPLCESADVGPQGLQVVLGKGAQYLPRYNGAEVDMKILESKSTVSTSTHPSPTSSGTRIMVYALPGLATDLSQKDETASKEASPSDSFIKLQQGTTSAGHCPGGCPQGQICRLKSDGTSFCGEPPIKLPDCGGDPLCGLDKGSSGRTKVTAPGAAAGHCPGGCPQGQICRLKSDGTSFCGEPPIKLPDCGGDPLCGLDKGSNGRTKVTAPGAAAGHCPGGCPQGQICRLKSDGTSFCGEPPIKLPDCGGDPLCGLDKGSDGRTKVTAPGAAAGHCPGGCPQGQICRLKSDGTSFCGEPPIKLPDCGNDPLCGID